MLSGLGGGEPLDKRAYRSHSKSAEPPAKYLWLRCAASEKHICAGSLAKLHLRALFIVIVHISNSAVVQRSINCPLLPAKPAPRADEKLYYASLRDPAHTSQEPTAPALTPQTTLPTHFVHILDLLPDNILEVSLASTFKYQPRALDSPPARKLPQSAQ